MGTAVGKLWAPLASLGQLYKSNLLRGVRKCLEPYGATLENATIEGPVSCWRISGLAWTNAMKSTAVMMQNTTCDLSKKHIHVDLMTIEHTFNMTMPPGQPDQSIPQAQPEPKPQPQATQLDTPFAVDQPWTLHTLRTMIDEFIKDMINQGSIDLDAVRIVLKWKGLPNIDCEITSIHANRLDNTGTTGTTGLTAGVDSLWQLRWQKVDGSFSLDARSASWISTDSGDIILATKDRSLRHVKLGSIHVYPQSPCLAWMQELLALPAEGASRPPPATVEWKQLQISCPDDLIAWFPLLSGYMDTVRLEHVIAQLRIDSCDILTIDEGKWTENRLHIGMTHLLLKSTGCLVRGLSLDIMNPSQRAMTIDHLRTWIFDTENLAKRIALSAHKISARLPVSDMHSMTMECKEAKMLSGGHCILKVESLLLRHIVSNSSVIQANIIPTTKQDAPPPSIRYIENYTPNTVRFLHERGLTAPSALSTLSPLSPLTAPILTIASNTMIGHSSGEMEESWSVEVQSMVVYARECLHALHDRVDEFVKTRRPSRSDANGIPIKYRVDCRTLSIHDALPVMEASDDDVNNGRVLKEPFCVFSMVSCVPCRPFYSHRVTAQIAKSAQSWLTSRSPVSTTPQTNENISIILSPTAVLLSLTSIRICLESAIITFLETPSGIALYRQWKEIVAARRLLPQLPLTKQEQSPEWQWEIGLDGVAFACNLASLCELRIARASLGKSNLGAGEFKCFEMALLVMHSNTQTNASTTINSSELQSLTNPIFRLENVIADTLGNVSQGRLVGFCTERNVKLLFDVGNQVNALKVRVTKSLEKLHIQIPKDEPMDNAIEYVCQEQEPHRLSTSDVSHVKPISVSVSVSGEQRRPARQMASWFGESAPIVHDDYVPSMTVQSIREDWPKHNDHHKRVITLDDIVINIQNDCLLRCENVVILYEIGQHDALNLKVSMLLCQIQPLPKDRPFAMHSYLEPWMAIQYLGLISTHPLADSPRTSFELSWSLRPKVPAAFQCLMLQPVRIRITGRGLKRLEAIQKLLSTCTQEIQKDKSSSQTPIRWFRIPDVKLLVSTKLTKHVEITLQGIQLKDMSDWKPCLENVRGTWIGNVSKHPKHSFLFAVNPVRALVNIGSATADLANAVGGPRGGGLGSIGFQFSNLQRVTQRETQALLSHATVGTHEFLKAASKPIPILKPIKDMVGRIVTDDARKRTERMQAAYALSL